MYDPHVTAAAIDADNRARWEAGEKWELRYHTRAQIDEAIAHFDALLDPETGALSQAKRPNGFLKEEVRFIQNERRLCALDFRGYFLPYYAFIINWEKQPQRGITPNVAQSIILDMWAETEALGLAIMMLQLKARQLGMSTLTELAICHRFQFKPYTCAAIASADPKKTIEMGKMIRDGIEHQPWWLLPDNTPSAPWKIEKGMPVEFPSLHSSILIQAGNQFHGVARGQTPNVFHLSELPGWPDAATDIDASLLHAIHETPDVFGIMESTAEGTDNWFYKEWELVKVDYPRGRSRIRPAFLPWFVGTDIYPPAADLRARPIPPDWQPSPRTVDHANRARDYVLSTPLLLRHLAGGNRDWQMPRAQQWYYEIEYEAARHKKDTNKFLAEMPASDDEAFQNTALSVIDQDVLRVYEQQVRVPVAAYAITGPGIHQSLIPTRREWDPTKPAIRVPLAGVCRSTEVYTFIPLKVEDYFGAFDPMFKLLIWHFPEDDGIYGIGVDTSDGIGLDWSVIEGLRKGDVERRHQQAFEWGSPYTKADQLWPMVLAVSAFYSVFNTRAGKRTQCRVCIECKGNGENVQDQLKIRGWWNFHPWKRLDNKRRLKNPNVHKEGIWTNVWFRSMMMDRFLTAVDEEMLDLGSRWLVKQMGKLVRDPDMASARAEYGANDDNVMAFGFPLYSLTVDDRPHQQTYRRSVPQYLPDDLNADAGARRGSYATFRPDAQSLDLPGRSLGALPVRFGRAARTGRFGVAPAPFTVPRRLQMPREK